ncbi:MAG: FAD-binding protein, partial [Pseudomonadota bacterium]|nr:FAD-binding protein [Pseudomonadota bacterium]
MPVEALGQIRALLGSAGIIEDKERMQPYLVSWRNGWTGEAPLIALPADTAQVSALLKICHEHHLRVVPQGGNTGLVGGAIP